MSKRVKKSPPGMVRILVRVNCNNLTDEERLANPKLSFGSISTRGWVTPDVAEKMLDALYRHGEDKS